MTTQELWQSQAFEAPRITPAYLRGQVDDSLRTARRRNFVEYAGAVFSVVVAIWLWFEYPNPWIRSGAAWSVIASAIYAWRWQRLATPATVPADLGALDTLRFYRRELERQYSAWQGHWRWVAPLYVPAMGLILYGLILLSGAGPAQTAFMILVHAAALALVTWHTEARAAKLRREIELLDLLAT